LDFNFGSAGKSSHIDIRVEINVFIFSLGGNTIIVPFAKDAIVVGIPAGKISL
jgi:hypothetical protein